jgi:hypothetical protein
LKKEVRNLKKGENEVNVKMRTFIMYSLKTILDEEIKEVAGVGNIVRLWKSERCVQSFFRKC